ncbi:MAG: cysteine synthase A [Clostridia bacterium]|nr:cysteine synthase A [Clostridia bacterium]MBR3954047.1 cysteine synthase A [Clostridia bacterium]
MEFNFGLGIDKDARIAKNLTELVGHTPMVELGGFAAAAGISCQLVAKLESFNPLGSAKDRVALAMIEDAEQKGLLTKDTVIVEPTSGNTGVGLAFVAAIKGYRLILTMPENMSAERMNLLRALGAELILTPADLGMQGSIDKANEIAEHSYSAWIPGQFSNPANADIHRKTTAAEILRDTYGKVDYFVAGVGTGGTITGVGEMIKAINRNATIVGVEPANSPVLSGGQKGAHGLQGIGAGFVPEVLNRHIIDRVIAVSEEEAYRAARTVARTDGLLVGISGGAALAACKKLAEGIKNTHRRIVVLLTDSGERYLSTDLFNY